MKHLQHAILFISYPFLVFCQKDSVGETPPLAQKHLFEVLDSSGSAGAHSKLILMLGGDSIALNKSGYSLQGWNETYYKSGKLLHSGYYIDGKLLTYKNYFENGQCESTFENTDPRRCLMKEYFDNGQIRKQTNYYSGLAQKQYEYYENGQPKSLEESDKELKYYILKKYWYNNGSLKSNLELQDLKNKKYLEKIYYNNGNVKEEGSVILLSGTKDYVKNGIWYIYDFNGKNKRGEKYNYGIRLSSK